MAYFGWRPEPKWTLTIGLRQIDITPYVFNWQVAFGAYYDHVRAEFRAQPTHGNLLLDNHSRRFDSTASMASVITVNDTAQPQAIRLTLGGRILWSGLVDISATYRLTPGQLIEWQLHGRWWQPLRRRILHTQRSRARSNSTPIGVLSDLVGRALPTGPYRPPNLDAISRHSRDSANLLLKDAYFDGTLAQAVDRLAWVTATIPYEDNHGRVGVRPPTTLDADVSTPPADQYVTDESSVEVVSTATNWGMVAAATNTVASRDRARIRVTVDPGRDSGVTRYVTPADVTSIYWADPVAVDMVDIVQAFVQPAPDGSRDYEFVWSTNNMNPQGREIEVTGEVYRPDAADPYDLREVWRPGESAPPYTEQQRPPAWLDFDRPANDPPGPSVTAAYETMTQWLNEPKLAATLVLPLWARDQSQAVTAGQLQIATGARYRLGAAPIASVVGTDVLDLMTLGVTLAGGADMVPRATIEALSWSGLGTPPGIAPAGTIVNPTEVADPDEPPSGIEYQAPGTSAGATGLLCDVGATGPAGLTPSAALAPFGIRSYEVRSDRIRTVGARAEPWGVTVGSPWCRIIVYYDASSGGTPSAADLRVRASFHNDVVGTVAGYGYVSLVVGDTTIAEVSNLAAAQAASLSRTSGGWHFFDAADRGAIASLPVGAMSVLNQLTAATTALAPSGGELPQWLCPRLIWQWGPSSVRLNTATFGAMAPLDFTPDLERAPAAASTVWVGQDAAGVPLSPRMGRVQEGRNPRFVVLHHAGAASSASELTIAENVHEWQKRQREYRGDNPVYSGYNWLLDADSDIDSLDPRRIRAFHAAAGNDGAGMMLGADGDWADISAGQLTSLLNRAAAKMAPYGIAARHATSLADARANGGIIGHSEIQAGKQDPGATFPYDRLVAVMASL